MLRQAFLFTALLLSSCAPPPEAPAPQAAPAPQLISNTAKKPIIPSNLPLVKIGLLLPLSGEASSLGNALQDAATLAIYDSYLSLPPEKMTAEIVLTPKNDGSTPEEAALAAKQLVDQGASIILGPLFGQNVPGAVAAAKTKNIPLITFSNTRGISSSGALVFGFVPEQQIDRVGEYALQHKIERIAVLAPNDTYGEKVRTTLQGAAARNGGQIGPIELYSSNQKNLDAAMTRLQQAYIGQPEEKRFQALFIAEGGTQLKSIIDSMKRHQLDPRAIKLLGTGQWDDAQLARNPDMFGAWFASASPEGSRTFDARFQATYHYAPPRIAGLAYDAVTLVVRQALANGGVVTREQLMSPQGFQTPAGGLARFNSEGAADRKLAVMEITPRGFKVLEAAPKSF